MSGAGGPKEQSGATKRKTATRMQVHDALEIIGIVVIAFVVSVLLFAVMVKAPDLLALIGGAA